MSNRWPAPTCGHQWMTFAINCGNDSQFLAVGDEDMRCLDTNLMLRSALPNAGLWICPTTGDAINLEEPLAFMPRSKLS